MPASTSGYPVCPSHQRSKCPWRHGSTRACRDSALETPSARCAGSAAARDGGSRANRAWRRNASGARAAGESLLDLTPGEMQAEVQVRREARGSSPSPSGVRALAHSHATSFSERKSATVRSTGPRGPPPPGGGLATSLLETERGDSGRDAPLGQRADGNGGSLRGSAEHLASAFSFPHVRCENGVKIVVWLARLACAGAPSSSIAQSPGCPLQFDAAALQRAFALARRAARAKRRHIAREVKRPSRVSSGRASLGQLALGRALGAATQPAATASRRAPVELGEALEQELRAWARCVGDRASRASSRQKTGNNALPPAPAAARSAGLIVHRAGSRRNQTIAVQAGPRLQAD